MKQAADAVYELAAADRFRNRTLLPLLACLNHINERYDFTWEREWRVLGDLAFAPRDVVCVILPEKGADLQKEKFLKRGVPVISPGWPAERIVAEFSDQARSARRLWVAAKSRRKTRKDGRSTE